MPRPPAAARLCARIACVLMACAAPSGALAQEAQEEEDALVLGPIRVFGARNARTLDDLTASVGVVGAAEIENRQLSTLRDAFRVLPNVSDSDFTDSGVVIRGVNSEGLTPGGAPLASVYVDGVRQTTNGVRRGARGLFDVEQVEVYRGPQSTLQGRAALAGAIHVRTKDPTYEREAVIQGTVGTRETRGAAIAVNAPIVEGQAALRLAAEFQTAENDLNYPDFAGFDRFDDFIDDEYRQFRGKLLLEPAAMPGFRALASYAYARDRPNPNDIGGPGLGFAFDEDRGDFTLPVFVEDREADNHSAGLELTQTLGDAFRLTSATGFSRNKTQRPSINEGTPGETNIITGDQTQELFSQEFRLNYDGARLSAVAGLFLEIEDSTADFVRPDFFGRRDVSRNRTEATNYALFGEATYEVVTDWRVIVGGRIDRTEQDQEAFFSRNGVATTDDAFSSDETVFLPKLGLVHDLTPDQTLGFTVQRGFRSGGAGVQRSTGEAYSFEPEFAWTYELSWRGRFLADRLSLGANLFYQDWSDQQVEIQADPNDFTSSRIANAAESESFGAEIEARWLATEALSLFAGVGYLDTEIKRFEDAGLGDLSGSAFPEASRWNLVAGGDWRHPSGFFIGADAEYAEGAVARFGTPPQDRLDDRIVVNAQAGWRNERASVALFAENLFDERYFTFVDNDIAATLGDRQVIGLRGEVRF